MPKEVFPSSYVCDCGMASHHFENTIREMREDSRTKRQAVVADDGEHLIIFHRGQFVAMWCPKVQKELPATGEVESIGPSRPPAPSRKRKKK